MRLKVKVQPEAKREEVVGFREGVLWVKVSEPPVDGKANERLREILASKLSIPKSNIRIIKGLASRIKEVEIEGLTENEVFRAFESGDKIS